MAPKENVENSNNLKSDHRSTVWHQVIQKTPGTLKAAVSRVRRPAKEYSGAAVRLGTPVWRPGLFAALQSTLSTFPGWSGPVQTGGGGPVRQITPRD